MSMVHRLLAQLKSRGLEVLPGNEPGQLMLRGPVEERTPEVMDALKKFKPQLLELFAPKQREPEAAPMPPEPAEADPEPESTGQVTCRTCGKDVTDPETRLRMADPLFCDVGRTSDPPCPFKPRNWV
jgi:hypothetical protein